MTVSEAQAAPHVESQRIHLSLGYVIVAQIAQETHVHVVLLAAQDSSIEDEVVVVVEAVVEVEAGVVSLHEYVAVEGRYAWMIESMEEGSLGVGICANISCEANLYFVDCVLFQAAIEYKEAVCDYECLGAFLIRSGGYQILIAIVIAYSRISRILFIIRDAQAVVIVSCVF